MGTATAIKNNAGTDDEVFRVNPPLGAAFKNANHVAVGRDGATAQLYPADANGNRTGFTLRAAGGKDPVATIFRGLGYTVMSRAPNRPAPRTQPIATALTA